MEGGHERKGAGKQLNRVPWQHNPNDCAGIARSTASASLTSQAEREDL
jgi:hypothetical protein